jgi:IS30 family transposase
MQTPTIYRQLQPEERMTIASMRLTGSGVRAMPRTNGRLPATISHEIERNASAECVCASVPVQALSGTRRIQSRPAPKLHPDHVLSGTVNTLLYWKWSLHQIAGILERVWPEDPTMHVSHETISTSIYARPPGELRRQLIACPRPSRSTRMPRRRGVDQRGQIPEMVSIHVHPPEIEDRLMPGPLEGDFIKGTGNKSSVGVVVERTSRLVLLARMDDSTAASALAGFTAKLNSIAAPMRHSLTYDQGKEMTRHRELTASTGVKVYFCDSHSPWQRGSCENTNGLLRQYLPKGTDLSVHTQADLDAIANSLNNGPRATHAFYSPLAVFAAIRPLRWVLNFGLETAQTKGRWRSRIHRRGAATADRARALPSRSRWGRQALQTAQWLTP